MRRISYFQQYSQKENWVTNNTLLLLSRLNYYSRNKFEVVMNQILDDSKFSLNIGANFFQQVKGEKSVVDGLIIQDGFEILIETKLYDNFDINQLQRHLNGFKTQSGTKILLALSKNEVNNKIDKEIRKELNKPEWNGVKFASTSFSKLIDVIDENIEVHEIEIKEILDDFVNLCEEHQLIDRSSQIMLGVTVLKSLVENLKYDIYYDSVTKNHNVKFKYLGIYDDKTIKAIGEVSKIVYCDLIDNELISTSDNKLNLTDAETNRIIGIIENTDYYSLRSGHKFLLVNKFYSTKFNKVSFSSLRSKKYFYLSKIEGYNKEMDTREIAEFLNERTWK